MDKFGMNMKSALIPASTLLLSSYAIAQDSDLDKITRAALDYIESQHVPNAEMMSKGIDSKLAKRTYWQKKDGTQFIMETNAEFMVELAESYNKSGDMFPESPTARVTILEVNKKVASVKLEADDWIDYMHLYKNDKGEWKILNVLWQYKDVSKHK